MPAVYVPMVELIFVVCALVGTATSYCTYIFQFYSSGESRMFQVSSIIIDAKKYLDVGKLAYDMGMCLFLTVLVIQ